MNIFAYEPIKEVIDRNKTWVDVNTKCLCSKEISTKPYFTLGKKINPTTDEYEYFVIFLDEIPIDRGWYRKYCDVYGVVCVDLRYIWKELKFDKLEYSSKVEIQFEEEDEHSIVYKILPYE